MTHRLLTAVCKADVNLKSAFFRGNFNIIPQVQPRRLELRQFLSQLSSDPMNIFDKRSNQKNGNKSGVCTAGGIGADRQSSSLSGGVDGGEGGEEKSKGGPGSDGNNKTRIYIVTASILGVCWVYSNQKDFNWKGVVDNFLSKRTVECECALAIPDVKSKPDETLQKGPNAIDQETTDSGNEKDSDPLDLAQLVNAAKSTDPQIQCSAVNSLRELFTSGRKPPIDFLIGCNILPTLVDCLSAPNPALQFDALTVLSEIVSPTSHHQIQAVVEAGAVPHFLRFLTSPHENARENALKALSCIIFFGPQLRDCVIYLGIVAPLLLNCIQRDTSTTFMRQVTGVIVNLCICIDPPPSHETVLEILPALNDLVQHSDPLVLRLAAWALKNLAEGGQDQIQMVIDSGVLPKLVQLLNYRGDEIPEVAAVAVGTIIVTATHDQTQAVFKCFALSHLHNLLEHPNETICRLALWVLASCVDENITTVQAAIEAGLIPLITHHLENGEFQTQMLAAYALSTMTMSGTKEQVEHLIDCSVIPLFCNLLNCKDSGVVQIVLDGIHNILTKFSVDQDDGDKVSTLIKECGGWDKIQALKNHENMKIREKANYIILKFSSDN